MSSRLMSRRLVLLAVCCEATLGVLGFAWMRLRQHPLPMVATPQADVAAGLMTAGVLAGVGFWSLRYAPDVVPIRSIRALYHELFRPLFAGLSWPQILLISALAGFGEELFFRGALQSELGIAGASLLFGAAHVGNRRMIAYGLWATGAGVLLGQLVVISGGLLAPIVGHGAYDALALAYIRLAPDDRLEAAAAPEGRVTVQSAGAPSDREPDRDEREGAAECDD